MRHGYLSDTQGKNQSQPAERGITTDEVTKCPFGHYSSLFGDRKVATQRAIETIAKGPPPESDFDRKTLIKIADARSSGVDDQPNDEYGGIPAGYTYFGQLVVHDLTHSVAIAGRDRLPFTLRNLSTPRLDLDTIYGGGPRRCPYLYQPAYLNAPVDPRDDGQHLFYLGRTAKAAFPENEKLEAGKPLDLPRIDTGSNGIDRTSPTTCVTPLVYDERNDDNLILGQLTAKFLRVHNVVANYLDKHGDPTASKPTNLSRRESFAMAQKFLIKAYRRVVVHDYLKHLLLPEVYDKMIAGSYKSPDHLPIEFVFGAARVGHAMVRAAYKVNERLSLETGSLGHLMAFSASSPGAKLPLPADWVVNWSNLLVMKTGDRPQSARRISPFLAPTFVNGGLRTRHTGLDGSLSFHDLWRCLQFNVPTGQECALRLFGNEDKVLKGEKMLPKPPFAQMHPSRNLDQALKEISPFQNKTPLSYYLLQEAALDGKNGRYLGPLGSHIYATAILYALKDADATSSPTPRTGLEFNEIVKRQGIVTLPQLLSVTELGDNGLRKAIVATLQ